MIVRLSRIELASPGYQPSGSGPSGLPTNLGAAVPQVRIERTPPTLQAGAQTIYATGANLAGWLPRLLHVSYLVVRDGAERPPLVREQRIERC
jgi:hypothetical protein